MLPYFPSLENTRRALGFDDLPEGVSANLLQDGLPPELDKICRENWAAFEPVGIVIDSPTPLRDVFVELCDDLLAREEMFTFVEPGKPGEHYQAFSALRTNLAKNYHYVHHQREIVSALEARFSALIGIFGEHTEAIDPDGLFIIPLWELLPDPLNAFDRVLGLFLSDNVGKSGALDKLWLMLWANSTKAGKTTFEDNKYVKPSKSGLSPTKAIDTYFFATPFQSLFHMPVTLAFTRKQRYDHMHILGSSGAGKTTMLEKLIARDIEASDCPSVVVIEPHSDLTKRLLARHIKAERRIIHIDPRDTEYPPALNLFHVSEERIAKYGEKAREQQATAIVDTFDFLFANLLNTELTGKQSFFLRYIARLLVTLPNTHGRTATLIDVMRLMEDSEPYRLAIDGLAPLTREFFERDFNAREYNETKQQIRYRIRAIIENPTLERLFSTEANAIDLFEALNDGTLILIDTAKDFLKSGSSVYGRIFLSLILQAILERAIIPEKQRRPTFVYIDEAADLIDASAESFITEARKYNAGLTLAHQRLDQAGSEFRSALSGTGLKLAGGINAADATAMAADMRCDKQQLLDLKKYRFAYFARGQLSRAVDVGVRPAPEPDWAEFERLAPLFREHNRHAISGKRQPSTPSQVTSAEKEDFEW